MFFLINMFCFRPKMGDKYWTKSYTKLADDMPLSVRSNETRFRNACYLFFHVNLRLQYQCYS